MSFLHRSMRFNRKDLESIYSLRITARTWNVVELNGFHILDFYYYDIPKGKSVVELFAPDLLEDHVFNV